jgi:CDP-4-dehydro-6-deoxyglucose reductase
VVEGHIAYPEDPPSLLNEADIAAGRALLCQARASSDVVIEAQELDALEGIPVRRLPCRVASIEQLAHDVMRVQLKLPESQQMMFVAGQYIDFILRDGRRRSFSIANAPHDHGFIELHVRHVSGGEFTDFIFSQLETRALLRIEGPFGTFVLREDSTRPIIFMAGGTGFAPIKGIIEHSLAQHINRPMHLYWGVRSLRDLYLDELPKRWAAEHDHIRYTPVLSAPLPEDDWQGRTGLVHQAIADDHEELSAYEIYAAGPPQMVRSGYEVFKQRGLTPDHYFSDAFEYAKD